MEWRREEEDEGYCGDLILILRKLESRTTKPSLSAGLSAWHACVTFERVLNG